jgi:aldehyde dehydrogenase (NAD+)
MLSWKIAPALACGNTILVKPAEQTPLSALLFANLVVEAGFPPGVINIINGLGNIAGAAMASHPDVDKISFTGSTATGKEVMKLASGTLKNVTLETGGKSPLLVLKDADLDLAVTHAHYGVMGNQGQICTSTSRILVHDSVFDDFMQKLLAHTGRVSIVGDPFDERTFQGPQVSKKQYDSILAYGRIGIQEGAKLECGGSAEKAVDGGFFIQPTIFSGVTESMRIYREEIFGPFAVVCRFDTEDQALRMANGLTYGLSAAVFTNDLSRAHHLARRLEAGMVWINSSQDSDYRIPFGGVKQSGVGRELGQAGLDAYCNIKSVHVNIGSDPYK